jgi:hypothetical protein
MNIHYIPRLTDEGTDEYNINEYMPLFISTGKYKSIFLGYVYWDPHPPCPGHMSIYSSVNQIIYWLYIYIYIIPVLAASPDGEPPKLVIQQIYTAMHIVLTPQGINR